MNIKVNNYLYNDNAQETWNFVKDQLNKKYGEATYKSWIEQIGFVDLQNGVLSIEAPTKFIREWVRSHYSEDIKSFWNSKENSVLDLNISTNNYLNNSIEQNNLSKDHINSDNFRAESEKNVSNDYDDVFNNPLDKRFTFDNFVVGTPNELAYAASRSVAESSKAQNKANPLFLYGGVGLGKTHLMHAVAWHIKQNDPKRKVIYVSAEKFMYQFIKALRNKDVMSFKELFRSADVLMIDDVQFICGKDSTQEELFHTLNTVMDNNRQLIISADRSPSDLAKMEERIKSRLAWGLVVDVHSTDYELRYRILMLKSTQMNVHIPKEVIEFLAAKITSNVRELEGALNKVVAHSTLIGGTITLETTQHILKDLLRANEKIITIDDIQRKVAERFNIKISEMFSACRVRNIARSRQIAMYLAKFLTSRSLAEIGKKFGGKDHTTVMHAIRKIEELMKSDSEINEDIEILTKILQN